MGSTHQGLRFGGECRCLVIELEEVDGLRCGEEDVAPHPNATRRRETPVGPPPYPRRAGAVHLPDRRIVEERAGG